MPDRHMNSPTKPLRPGRPIDAKMAKPKKNASHGALSASPPKSETPRLCARS